MKKYLKLIICLVLSIGIILSFCLMVHNPCHNCIGEDCQLCREVALQRNLLKSVLVCIIFGGIILSALRLMSFLALLTDIVRGKINLVANKVKLTA